MSIEWNQCKSLTHTHMCIYIYIYIQNKWEREKEREREFPPEIFFRWNPSSTLLCLIRVSKLALRTFFNIYCLVTHLFFVFFLFFCFFSTILALWLVRFFIFFFQRLTFFFITYAQTHTRARALNNASSNMFFIKSQFSSRPEIPYLLIRILGNENG